MFFNKQAAAKVDSIKLSLPQSRNVRGYEIRRLPIGPMLDAVDSLQDLPGDLIKACFPGMDAGQILAQLKGFNADMLVKVLGNAMTTAPRLILRTFARLAGLDEQKLLDDPNVGFDGLMELISAWLEVSGIENFTSAGRAVLAKVKAAAGSFRQQNTGSKD